MKMRIAFDDLADLAMIEILSHLSCTDALFAFTCLNDRWTHLLAERGFFSQVNLSSTCSRQFDQLLQILSLDNIETLVIDRTASPLQLRRWPYLPRLTKLHLRGVREYDSILFFALLHATTLSHVTIESDEYSLTVTFWNQPLYWRSGSLLRLGWIIGQAFSYNSFSASTRSKYSTSLLTESSHARPRLRFQSFHHGLGHHSRSSSAHLSTRHFTLHLRSAGHHEDTTTLGDTTIFACEVMWPCPRWMCANGWNKDSSCHDIAADVYFRQITVSAVPRWMEIDRCIDLIHCHASVATS